MSEQVRRFMAPTNDTCDMDSYQQVVLAADHDAAVQALRADAREWKAKAEEALNDWRKACQLNGDAAEREFKLKAEAEALRAENGRLRPLAEDRDQQYEMKVKARQQRDEMRAQIEAARGLLRDIAPFFAAPHGRDDLHHRLDALLAATPAPEVKQDESLDDRLKQAGMLSVADLLKGAPLDTFIKHAGVHDLGTLLQWAEMRRGECLRMMARYDLGEKDKGDDLYEWTVAHCAVFTELHVNLRAALADQGERQEAVATVGAVIDRKRKVFSIDILDAADLHPGTKLYTTPQPGPDVRGLVEALEQIQRWDGFPPTGKFWEGSGAPMSYSAFYGSNGERDFMRNVAANALSANRQTQQGDSHDT